MGNAAICPKTAVKIINQRKIYYVLETTCCASKGDKCLPYCIPLFSLQLSSRLYLSSRGHHHFAPLVGKDFSHYICS